MPPAAWTTLQSVDDDLLTLEAAAVLSLAAKHRMSELNAAVKGWTIAQFSFAYGDKEPQAAVDTAVEAVKNSLHLTGLVLPEAVNRSRLTTFDAALQEMTSIVRGPIGALNSPQAAVAVLNLVCEESIAQRDDIALLLRSGLIQRAWRQVHHFVHLLHSKAKPHPVPKMVMPVADDWRAHDGELVSDTTPWSLGIGPMFHTLAGWDSAWLMGKGMMKGEQWNAISYWTPLVHLVLGPLGWSDPAVGVARWILLGMPNETPELSLMAKVWGPDALMYFGQRDWVPLSYGASGLQYEPSSYPIGNIYEDSESAADYHRCDELHMGAHIMIQMFAPTGPQRTSPRVYMHRGEPRESKFVLELSRSAGWRSALQVAGETLWKQFHGSQVEITVLAPPLGSLGTFRRSPATRLWYSGSEEAHLLGHSRSSIGKGNSTLSGPPVGPKLVSATSHGTASAFWLASELCRRHPRYVLHGDGLDSGGELRLVSSSGPAIRISRGGTVGVEGSVRNAIDVVDAHDKRELIRAIEKYLGLPVKGGSSPTTGRTIVYRVLAQILALVAREKTRWDITAVDNVSNGTVWELVRGNESVATFLPDGDVVMTTGTVCLLERYNAHSRKLSAMVGDVFGSVLP